MRTALEVIAETAVFLLLIGSWYVLFLLIAVWMGA